MAPKRPRVNRVSARDVATAIVACVDNPEAHGKTIELSGPDAVSALEVVQLAESISIAFRHQAWRDFKHALDPLGAPM
jgi:uncharacterized protein YbjT (DUF2867 family)